MGLLDLPGPLFDLIDTAMMDFATPLRLVLWGAAAGAAAMLLYAALSPQAHIARSKRQQRDLRRQLDGFDGDLGEAWPLMRRLLGLALTQVGRVAGPAVLASVPVLSLLVWISTSYGYVFPREEAPAVRVTPDFLDAEWLSDGIPRVVISDEARRLRIEVPVPAPVPLIERWHWWNAIAGNPAGYLDPANPARRVEIDLPRRQCLDIGPGWMRGWEFTFISALLLTSLLLKGVLRIA